MKTITVLLLLLTTTIEVASAAPLPAGYMTAVEARRISEQTRVMKLAPDLSHLTEAERDALPELMQAGHILHRLYLRQNHAQAESSLRKLRKLHARGEDDGSDLLLDLFAMAKGPIVTDLENRRVAILPVEPESPGRNVYPADLTREQLDAWLDSHPEQRAELLGERSIVQRSRRANLRAALATLDRHPVLDTLHPGLRDRLTAMKKNRARDDDALFALPYSIAYAGELMAVYGHLNAAASSMQADDKDFAAYLRNRARDLLSDDYESGDASWVSGRFGNLNTQIGSYETYDDKLYGVKSFFGMSILARDPQRSAELARVVSNLQKIEDQLPYDDHQQVRSDIPVSVYRVIADFGQSRSANTATILPNDANHARKYGRTILLRYNVMTNPGSFKNAQAKFAAATVIPRHADLIGGAGFRRTLFHEIGHYLGVKQTADGRPLNIALSQSADLYEEMKSDLVSLFAAHSLARDGLISAADLRATYAAGVLRTLQLVEPRREQPYQTMQLMQFNYFLDRGALSFDDENGLLDIDYARFHAVVTDLLREVLAIQAAGDPARAGAFIERWGSWQPRRHGRLAGQMRDAVLHRFTLMRYAAEGVYPETD